MPMATQKIKVYIENYGCSANASISEFIRGIMKSHGYEITQNLSDADLTIINTCIVKQNTEHRMKSRITELAHQKPLIVTGCLPIALEDWLKQQTMTTQNISVIHPDYVDTVPDITLQLLKNGKTIFNIQPRRNFTKNPNIQKVYINPIISIVEINRGCLSKCSFCIVKDVKGHLKSRTPGEILKEIQYDLINQCQEIWLTSQDTAVYGRDFGEPYYLPDLVRDIVNMNGDFWLRIGMGTPWGFYKIIDPLLDAMKSNKVFKFLHIPIQTGSQKILRKMRRGGSIEQFKATIKKIRAHFPEFTLSTDIITGFPGETDDDHQLTIELLKEIQPAIVNLSKYTDRPGTEAAKMKNKVPTHIKAQRSKELSQLKDEIAKKHYSQWIGWKGIVLIDKIGKYKHQYIARNYAYVPTLIQWNEPLPLGTKAFITVTEVTPTHVIAEVEEIVYKPVRKKSPQISIPITPKIH